MSISPLYRAPGPTAGRPPRALRPVGSSGKTRLRRAACAALAGLLTLAPAGTPVLAIAAEAEKPPAYAPKSEGFTRESMAELSRPEPPPAPPGPLVSPRVTRPQVDGKDYVPRRVSSSRRTVARTQVDGKDYGSPTSVARRMQRARPDERRVAARSRVRKRNPAESFVYWWNGWVIRTFHTKIGTVMLGTIGAKS